MDEHWAGNGLDAERRKQKKKKRQRWGDSDSSSSELVVWENLVVMVMDVEVEEGIWWMAAVIVVLARP